MYLVDNIDGVLTDLRRNAHLVNERTDIVHRVVRCRIQFVDIERSLLVERPAGLAFVAGIVAVLRVKTVDRLRKNTRAGGFTYSTRTAKQVRVRQMVLTDSVL